MSGMTHESHRTRGGNIVVSLYSRGGKPTAQRAADHHTEHGEVAELVQVDTGSRTYTYRVTHDTES